jgi:malate dehydrogenase (quinone)
MVLAVGDHEVDELEKRYKFFRNEYPDLRKVSKEEIAKIEPKLVEGRDPKEKILALVTEGYVVDFGEVARSFVEKVKESKKGYSPEIFFSTEIKKIELVKDWYEVTTSVGKFLTKVVVVAAGPQSLVFAKKLGYGKEFGILPVAGNFYQAKNVLRGKVYMMQIPGMPFAAIHGDPDIKNPSETRFGPTIRVLPLLERHRYKTVKDFLWTSVWNISGVLSLLKITFRPTILRYIIKNVLYDLSIFGKWLFVCWEIKKIVPSIKANEVSLLYGKGGIRPQVVNINKKELEFGESEIVGKNIIFSITPSPGASVSLGYAKSVAEKVVDFFDDNIYFNYSDFKKDLM